MTRIPHRHRGKQFTYVEFPGPIRPRLSNPANRMAVSVLKDSHSRKNVTLFLSAQGVKDGTEVVSGWTTPTGAKLKGTAAMERKVGLSQN